MERPTVRLPYLITISRTTGEITKHYEDVDIMAHKDIFLGLIRLGRHLIEDGIVKEEDFHEKQLSCQPN